MWKRRVGDEGLASGNAIAGVEALAERLRQKPALKAWFDATPSAERVEHLTEQDPAFARDFAELRRRVGHRGPGELELANDVFDDAPEQLLDAIVKTAVTSPPPVPESGRRGVAERLATSANPLCCRIRAAM